ncbi:hypothetical protein JM946_17635 [Steroidobacter sp. S1-65]|uniref:Uncharacterized protein n=1 Tax=Steroidobacter gossypii TaxID=2805490 RepID=A0ABS1WZY6_9GAMM|nr:hypothetical protein [Steroidobacter gossypii]MBM0106554.1 hypothetical protein [Steroidobacter gossypii]
MSSRKPLVEGVRTGLSFLRPLIFAVGALCTAQQAQAAVDCVGKVAKVLLYSDGTVNIVGQWRGDYTFVCSTSGSFGTVSAEVCLSWYATLMKAKADNLDVTVYYNTNTACSALPTYGNSPVPVYIGLF